MSLCGNLVLSVVTGVKYDSDIVPKKLKHFSKIIIKRDLNSWQIKLKFSNYH